MLSTSAWFFIFACMAIAAGCGCITGIMLAPIIHERRLRRATQRVETLSRLVCKELERAHRACVYLGVAGVKELPRSHFTQFLSLQARVEQALQQIAMQIPQRARANLQQQIPAKWIREPIDVVSGLPGEEAYEQNLLQLCDASRSGISSGLMLVEVDKFDQLVERFGPADAQKIQLKLSSLIGRHISDADLLCASRPQQFAVLWPDCSPLEGIRLSEALRHIIRQHTFRLDEDRDEIFVTASFGFAAIVGEILPESVHSRARLALSRSRSIGRNQLHVDDGSGRHLVRLA